MPDQDHKDFLLAALRCGSLRAKMYENEINSIGVALKSDLIEVGTALVWLNDIGAMALVGYIPDEMRAEYQGDKISDISK